MAGSRGRYSIPKGAPEEETVKQDTPKRIQAIPFSGGTTVIVRSKDFQNSCGINHDEVVWDYRIDNFCVKIGEGISDEAASFLAENYPNSFKIING